MIMKSIVLNCDYVQGHLSGGYFELELSDKEYEEFKSQSKEEQLDWIKDCGDLKINSYTVDYYETEKEFRIIDEKDK